MDLSQGIALIQSKTFWGALLALVAIVGQQFGASAMFAWATDPHTADNIMSVVAMIGAVVAIIGRAMATKPVTSIVPPKAN